MDFSNISQYTTVSLEGAACFILIVIGWKLLKAKIHTRSGCCHDSLMIETMNRADSKNDLEFTVIET